MEFENNTINALNSLRGVHHRQTAPIAVRDCHQRDEQNKDPFILDENIPSDFLAILVIASPEEGQEDEATDGRDCQVLG